MGMISYLLVIVGLPLTAAGFALPDRVRSPLDGLVAFLAPLGIVSSIVGVLLICLPDFFAQADPSGVPAAGNQVRVEIGESP